MLLRQFFPQGSPSKFYKIRRFCDVLIGFQIYNNGPSTVSKAQVRIVWPSYTRNKMHLLYIMEEPHIDGPNTNCSKVPANVANVAVR